MTSSNAQSQQEVDDILSSIRQMIAEEEANNTSAKDNSGDISQNKILDLTKLVQDDGSVVELSSQSNAKITVVDTPTAYADTAYAEKTRNAQFSENVAQQQATTINNNNHYDEINTKTQNPQASSPDIDALTSASQQSITPPQPQASSTRNSPIVSPQDHTTAAFSTPADADNLLSDHTIQESAAAFAALSQATQQHYSQLPITPITTATAPGTTVDDLMRELLQPLLKNWLEDNQQQELLRLLLKDWLDAHLPSLVKNLVLEQIEKVSQQPKTTK